MKKTITLSTGTIVTIKKLSVNETWIDGPELTRSERKELHRSPEFKEIAFGIKPQSNG